MLKIGGIILSGLLATTICCAQSEFLSSFTGFQSDHSILLTFTIRGGITCLGTDIERSEDSMNFTTIGTISGVCGSSSEDVTYTFDDNSPLINKDNYYRLLLGQVGYSETIKVQFIDYSNGAVIFPNPMHDHATLFIPNTTGEMVHFRLYDASGRLLQQLQTNDPSLELNATGLSRGIFFYLVEQEGGGDYRGKLIVE